MAFQKPTQMSPVSRKARIWPKYVPDDMPKSFTATR